eukprot:TRINITY_DN4783_c0_g1_i6.p1 TRINITY_DN4783_c0_g1~~TRINITY_DN4783_c0_g1_i6.p1  ORF type:complete len:161 (+),score=15.68 TRINITY_DN4783_c0_g1_i6:348-830(+)
MLMGVIMGFTLLAFFLYHCTLIWEGVTTNERIKKSDTISYLKKQIDTLKKSLKDDLKTEKERAPILQEIKNYEQHIEALEKIGEKGFVANVKRILNPPAIKSKQDQPVCILLICCKILDHVRLIVTLTNQPSFCSSRNYFIPDGNMSLQTSHFVGAECSD